LIHKIGRGLLQEKLLLYWILSLILCFARLLACSFFFTRVKKKRTKKENRRLSLQSYSAKGRKRERESFFLFVFARSALLFGYPLGSSFFSSFS